MTIGEAIYQFRDMVPSAPDDAVLIGWLSEIEKTLVSEIILTHASPPDGAVRFEGYKNTGSREAALFADEEFCRLYVEYLAMKYYIAVCDIKRYNAFAELFFNSYGSFANAYNRRVKPLARVSGFKTEGVV